MIVKVVRVGCVGLIVSLLAAVQICAAHSKPLTAHPASGAFIDRMVNEHGFRRDELQAMFAAAELRPSVIERISRPAEALPWWRYREIFLVEKRILGGAEFWSDNRATLTRAEQEFGVPPEIIVAIIGVETQFGRYLGKDPVLESLATLAFEYPRRSQFFTRELEEFLLLAREENFKPLEVKGSYAGAMGLPQFIASSYRRLAIDFDGDERRDLIGNPSDAIGSVANYLSKHGWRRGETVAVQATVRGDRHQALIDKGLKPSVAIDNLSDFGVEPSGAIDGSRAALVHMDGANGSEFWLGLDNFYAITRYNHSALYALAVHQLSQEILAKVGEQ